MVLVYMRRRQAGHQMGAPQESWAPIQDEHQHNTIGGFTEAIQPPPSPPRRHSSPPQSSGGGRRLLLHHPRNQRAKPSPSLNLSTFHPWPRSCLSIWALLAATRLGPRRIAPRPPSPPERALKGESGREHRLVDIASGPFSSPSTCRCVDVGHGFSHTCPYVA
jgi:hypothetical protein